MPGPWKPPAVGDILWCHFPQPPATEPGPKPRPALVLRVDLKEEGAVVAAAYGTSKRTDKLLAGEFAIRRALNPVAFVLGGLSFDTKFNLKQVIELPWTEAFFKVPPMPKYGQTPKLGTLHPSMMQAARAAYLVSQIKPA
jgi:mRNA-degrading endonuclease toxin of MazEF toxin-antitoxin module